MDIKQLQAQMDQAREASKKVYPERENSDGWVKNDTFTSMRQAHVPNGVFEFRILPPFDGRNPGMYVVQKHKILESYGTKADGTKYPSYVQVLGSVTNPDVTVVDSIIKELIHIERTQPAKWAELTDETKEIIKAFKGETYIEVPCIFRAQHENRPFKIGTKSIDSYFLTKADKNNYIGKVFQMKSASIYGQRLKNDDGTWSEEYNGVMGAQLEWGDIDSLGADGRWLKLKVAGKGGKGFPSYSVETTKDAGPLPDSLMHFMSEENYPNLYKKNDYFKKSNDEILNLLKNSKLIEIFDSLGFTPQVLAGKAMPLPF